ncbi:hypothetical protein [Actinomadura rugatobispora]|uniref:DUF3618 domain-containing protein n=1 Tax=Actinomadura rugatobispora TaxID=1994 RepID=A0ABW1A5L9_9ACTN
MMSIRRKPHEEALTRLGRMQAACRQGASGAAGRVGPAARSTRDVAAGRVLVARGWSAPRLRKAGTYVETELGPRMGAMLSNAARRVEPPHPVRKGRNVAMTMVAAASAVGLAGALLTRRSGAQEPAGQESGRSSATTTAPADADGQVRTP